MRARNVRADTARTVAGQMSIVPSIVSLRTNGTGILNTRYLLHSSRKQEQITGLAPAAALMSLSTQASHP